MADNIVWDDEKSGIVWDDEKPATSGYGLTDKPGIAEQFLGGAKHAWDRAAAGLESLVPGGRDLSQALGQPDMQQLVKQGGQFVKETGPASTVGQIAGDIALSAAPAIKTFQAIKAIAPLRARAAAAIAGEAGVNAGYGALTADEGKGGEGAAWGAGGTVGGHALGRALGGLVRPTAEARSLMDRGVSLTPGQAAGVGTLTNRIEQQLTSFPLAGHFISNSQRRAVEEANVAAAQSVANIVDKNIKLGLPPREAIEQTRDLVGKTFDESLEGMTLPTSKVKNDLTAMLPDFINDHPMITQDHLKRLGRYVDVRFGDLSRNGTATLDGQMLKTIDSEIGDQIRSLRRSSTAAERDASFAWADLQQELRGLMESGAASPEHFQKLNAANGAYKQLLALEKSMLAGNETFTPRRLQATLQKMHVRNTDLNTVGDAMAKTLPNSVPNSGTAERLLITGLPALLMGGGVGASNMGFDTLGAGMLAAGALGSRTGAKVMTGGYAAQPYMEAAARHLRRGATPALAGGRKKDD